MSERSAVLLIGSDLTAKIARHVARELGADVIRASTADRGLVAAGSLAPVLVLAEHPLPDLAGPTFCERFLLTTSAPLTLLMERDDPEERIRCLEAGADDCLVRPFNPAEVLVRQRALLRRRSMAMRRAHDMNSERASYGTPDITVEPASRAVSVGERQVALREREFHLLLELVRRPGRVVTREELLRRVWGYEDAHRSATLDVHVHRLRHKLGDRSGEPHLIQTVKGIGYRLSERRLS